MRLPELEQWFRDNPPPPGPIRLDVCTVVMEPQKFIDTHIAMLKGQPGNKTFLPYWERLIKLYLILNKKS